MAEFLLGPVIASFSAFGLTRGTPLGGNGDSLRSSTGDGDRGF